MDYKFYSPNDISKILSVSMNTVYRYLRSGVIMSIQIDRKYYIPSESIDLFITQGIKETPSDGGRARPTAFSNNSLNLTAD